MALLEHELAQARFQYNLVLAAILEDSWVKHIIMYASVNETL